MNAPESNADFTTLLEKAESKFYAWHLKKLQPERDRRMSDLHKLKLTSGGRAVHAFRIDRELLEKEVRKRIGFYRSVARKSKSAELISESRLDEHRQRIMTTVGHAIARLKDQVRQDAAHAGDTPATALPSENRYVHLQAQILTIVDAELRVLEAKGKLLGHATRARRGYRVEVRKWMQEKGIRTVPEAAERLSVGLDTLKSIMSSRGKKRYSDDTLDKVLVKIGVRPKHDDSR